MTNNKFTDLLNSLQFMPLKINHVSPSKIKAVRAKFRLRQCDFAELIGVKYHTYKAWEIGYRHPSSPACAILAVADQFPENFLKNREKFIDYINNNYGIAKSDSP